MIKKDGSLGKLFGYSVYPWSTVTTKSQTYYNPFGGYPMNANQALLYDVYMVYAENLTEPIVKRTSVIAKTEDDAKVKSGLMKEINQKWDTDYLSFIVNRIGIVTFKEKPQEVKVVKEVTD